MSAVEQLSQALLARPRALKYFETGLLSVINISAVIGNLLVCLAVYRNQRLRTIPNTFVVALAISDILMSSLPMPLSVVTLAHGTFIHSQPVCYFQGFCIFTFGLISLQTMGIIAVNRYFRICRPNQHMILFKFRTTIYLIVITWATAQFASMPPLFLHNGHYTFQPGKAMCLIPFEANIGYTAFVEVFYVATPLSLIVICYVLVFRTVQISNKAFKPQDADRLRAKVEEAKVTQTLLVVFVGFAACWMPVSVIDYIDAGYGEPKLNRSVYLMYGFLIYISSTLNPFIYGVMNRAFRREYIRIVLGLAWPWCKTNQFSETSDGKSTFTTTNRVAPCADPSKVSAAHNGTLPEKEKNCKSAAKSTDQEVN